MAGRKQTTVTYEQVLALRRHPDRLTWDAIAAHLGCSRRTVIRIYQTPVARKPKK